MLFPTATFAIFFLVVFPLSWLLSRYHRAWRLLALGASYVFYGFWDWRFLGLIAASTLGNAVLVNVLAGRSGRSRRLLLAAAVAFNLGILGTFKYYGFFAESVNASARWLGMAGRVPLVEIILPVGISFYTFQALSYVGDVYRRVVKPVPLLDFAVYLAFFPQLVAGPIVRASEFLPQLRAPRALGRDEASRAFYLIAAGLFKKVALSSYLATTIVDPVFAVPGQHTAPEILLAVYGYAVQIYADFSGYTDMAIGIALLLGFRFPQNFNRPYAALSVQDFWRRWHMTLSRWLRDYLYIPLGGSRRGSVRTYVNLMLTMILGGLWHGAAATFVAWGAFHGLGLALERLLAVRPAPGTDGVRSVWPGHPWLSRLVTFHFVCVGWVLFRAESLGAALEMLSRAVTAWGPAPAVTAELVLVVGAALAVQLAPRGLERLEVRFGRLWPVAQGAVLGLFVFLTLALSPPGVAPFIYFQF